MSALLEEMNFVKLVGSPANGEDEQSEMAEAVTANRLSPMTATGAKPSKLDSRLFFSSM